MVRTFDPSSEILFEVQRTRVRRRDGSEVELSVSETRAAGKDIVLTLAEIQTRDEAEALVGGTVFVFREEIAPPEAGEFFQGDLVGLEAFAEDGRALGRVEEIWNTGEVPTLVIRKPPEELLVPFADDFVGEVDVEGGRIVVRPPEIT